MFIKDGYRYKPDEAKRRGWVKHKAQLAPEQDDKQPTNNDDDADTAEAKPSPKRRTRAK